MAESIRGREDIAIKKIKAYFKEYGMEERVQEFDVSSATVVAAGDTKIDNPKYKAEFGTKAKMQGGMGGADRQRGCREK